MRYNNRNSILIKTATALISLLAVCFGIVITAKAMVLVAEQDLPVPPISDFVVADLTGSGRSELVAVGPDGVFVLAPANDDGEWEVLTHVPPLPAAATAVAVGDFIGDGVPAIAVGTDQAGAVYILRWTGTDWVIAAQSGYLWAPVTALTAIDLSGDSRPELVAVDAGGGVTVLAWVPGEHRLAPAWQWPRAMGRALAVSVAELGEPGVHHLVIADDEGRVSVWAWPLMGPLSQAFVWGTPTAMTVADVLGTGPQLVVSTDERLLYRFIWENDRLVQATTPLNNANLPFDFMVRWRWPGDTTDRILAHSAAGLGVWRVTSSSISRVDDGWANTPIAAALWPDANVVLVAERIEDGRGVLRTWARKANGYFNFVVDDMAVRLTDTPLFEQETVLLSARDWANALGLQLYWDSAEQRLTVVGRQTYAMMTAGERLVTLPAGIRATSVAPVLQNGRMYVPPEFPAWFGATYQWDARKRELRVETLDEK